MSPEQLRQIEDLYHAVRDANPEERAGLLALANSEVRVQVESLLLQRISGEFFDRPAYANAPELLGDLAPSALTAGTCLGPYRIQSKLGEGGMGEVFRAVDTRLDRVVAIKTLREQFSFRFEREARAISSLNHPNICTLFDVGPNYLVMELVEGTTLATHLTKERLAMKIALRFALQIAAALAEAHDKGIIHCDLKPGNIMIGKSGVKVLDFGLANLGTDEKATAKYMVIGTPAYMAPEQRAGKAVDARTDIYSFGCILYEMFTGTRAGTGQKPIRSRHLQRIVNRCLEKNPDRRWQSAAELDRELSKTVAAGSGWYSVSAAALAALAGAYLYVRRAPPLGDKDRIVLADFENKTGDPVFDDTLRQALTVELGQSPFLSLISDAQVRQTLVLMGRPRETGLTPELAAQACERAAGTAVVEGSIASVGSQYVLGLRARSSDSGKVLADEQITSARKEDVLNSLSQIARKLRVRLGESKTTVKRHSVPLAEATTVSLEALKAYTAGIKTALSSGSSAALPFFRRAVRIDPRFAMAHAMLGLMYSSAGESVSSVQSTTQAWRLRDRVSDRERFFIDFTYDRQVTGNLENAYQTLELWLQTYPRGEQPNPQSLLGGLSTHGTGRFERAIEATQAALATDPDFVLGYINLAYSFFLTSRFPEAEQTLQSASERKFEMPDLLVIRYNIAALNREDDQMKRIVESARGKRRAEHWVAHAEALALVRCGRVQAARRAERVALDLASQEGEHEAAASYRAAQAVWEALCGNAPDGIKNADAALELSHGRDVEYAAGLALALTGSTPRTVALADDLEKRFPEDTFVKFTYLPILRAFSSLELGKPAEAIELLQTAVRYERAVNGLNFAHLYLGGLHSAYVRGDLLIGQHRYREAVTEFQKILDNRGLVGLDPIGALAYWRLGRAYSLAGDPMKAKTAYEQFFALWKDADRDVPILEQVKAEYRRLQG